MTPLAGETAGAQSAALISDGRLVLAGVTVIAPVYRATVLRLLADPPPLVDGGPGGGGGGGDPAPDTQALALGALKVTGKVAGRRPRITFTLSEPARVRLVITRRGRRAQRFAIGAVAGTNRVRAPRRLARALPPHRGRHRRRGQRQRAGPCAIPDPRGAVNVAQ